MDKTDELRTCENLDIQGKGMSRSENKKIWGKEEGKKEVINDT